ncbi:MAG: anti-sigma factor antagonist [Anaerolineae bacterium]|nr:anti-sigma factor antagonist [Anaerolineae bacterium]
MAEMSRLAIPARLEEVRQACDFVVEAAEQTGLDERAVYHCQMAVDEALTNIIEHGFAYHDDGSEIEIACRAEPDRFIVTIADNSPAFNPLLHEAPDPSEPLDSREPGGWGIYFIRKLMDDVTYERADDRNLLTLVKFIAAARRPAPPGSAEEAHFPIRVLDALTAVISPAGRLDSSTSLYLEHALEAQLASGRTWLYVDMAAVEYIASSGLKVLVTAWRRAREKGGDVVLSSLQPRLVEIFEMVGFDMLFQVFPDLDSALAARPARP